MKFARFLWLGIALIAGGAAFVLMNGVLEPTKTVEAPQKIPTVKILVAASDIALGNVVAEPDLAWQEWPEESVQPQYITMDARPDALKKLAGSTARAELFKGEPVNENKLVKANGSGFMSAILPSGMRAVSTPISVDTGAGGFILPNDHVDVILTHRVKDQRDRNIERHVSETILSNVRVLAIDQTIKEKDGEKVVVGKTATLELRPRQSEVLALARARGDISLALRSLQDSLPGGLEDNNKVADEASIGGKITVLRYGIASSVTQAR
ncbi:MAG TPA: Flp pilus assembly protein CpaB [Rhodobacteraceae bacterium]|nr:Flp pilus assembly protein CpaB [Paracoccaceae bacterium]